VQFIYNLVKFFIKLVSFSFDIFVLLKLDFVFIFKLSVIFFKVFNFRFQLFL